MPVEATVASGSESKCRQEPATVVVLRFSSAGDVVLTSPAIDALKRAWPDAKIRYVVKRTFADLVRSNPNISEVVELAPGEGLGSIAGRIRAGGCEAILDLHSTIRSVGLRALLPRGIPRAVWTKRPLLDAIRIRTLGGTYHAAMPIADRYHRAVESLTGRSLPRGDLRLWTSGADRARVAERLASAGIDAKRTVIGMSPGANWATKRWPVERYAELARRLDAKGLAVVATGSGAEQPVLDSLRAASPGVTTFAGGMSLGELAAMIERCAAFVANDSGPMHMARALGIPALAFFGSTDPKQFEFDGHALLFRGLECSPCSFFGYSKCPQQHFRCMLDTDVDSAWNALEPLLTRGRVGFVHA